MVMIMLMNRAQHCALSGTKLQEQIISKLDGNIWQLPSSTWIARYKAISGTASGSRGDFMAHASYSNNELHLSLLQRELARLDLS